MIYVLGPHDKKKILSLKSENVPIINTTSSSTDHWSKQLSPFFLGPISLYKQYSSRNVENAWQFSKVYKRFVGEDGYPIKEYFVWAQRGWNDTYARRYPMGKGTAPEYSYWNGEKLDYVSARLKIYIPLYSSTVTKTEAFKKLKGIYNETKNICLWDYDAYDHYSLNMTLKDVAMDPKRKMGHAFVLAMLLNK